MAKTTKLILLDSLLQEIFPERRKQISFAHLFFKIQKLVRFCRNNKSIIMKVFALNVVIACLVLVASSSGNAEAAAKGPKVRKLTCIIHHSPV